MTNLEFILSIGTLSPQFFSSKARRGGYFLQQNPEEFAELLDYMQSLPRIQSYLEIGSASGGFIRCIYERVGFEKAVMIDDGGWQIEEQLKNISEFQHLVSRNILDSHSRGALEIVKQDTYDFIFIDGDHSYEGVCKDIDLVLPYARTGAKIVFHDIQCEKVPGVGQAYEEAISTKLREIKRIVNMNEYLTFGIGITEVR